MTTTLQSVLNDRVSQALARVEQLTAGVPDLRSASAATQVELEQALDDADRYLSLADRVGGVRIKSEPRTYRPDLPYSFLTDLVHQPISHHAKDRLERHARECALEQRDVSSVTFGGLVPPAYVAEVFAAAAGPGRPFADLVGSHPIPDKGMELISARVTAGAAAGAASQNATNATDVTLEDLVAQVCTYDGTVNVSVQIIDRGGPAADRALAQELGLAVARAIDGDMLLSDGTSDRVLGITQVSGINTVTYDTSPSPESFVSAIGDAATQAALGRGLPPQVVVMHSRRWFWLAAQSSLPRAVRIARPDDAPDSVVGTALGLWVVLDDNIGITHGASTNEDLVVVTRLDNFALLEGPVQINIPRTGVESGKFSARVDVAFWPDRYPAGTSVITGTGLAVPPDEE